MLTAEKQCVVRFVAASHDAYICEKVSLHTDGQNSFFRGGRVKMFGVLHGVGRKLWRAVRTMMPSRNCLENESGVVRWGSTRRLLLCGTAFRCIVHKQRNLLAHAPKRLHEEINADCAEMIRAETPEEVEEEEEEESRRFRLLFSQREASFDGNAESICWGIAAGIQRSPLKER